ncbi:MAG: SDR family NAD(P)-dependent oxidoreductase [Moorea sp. SIO4G2]|uniref:SDR family NAD(P)-dependent oxidoreductase n=1 Tax=Moorena sp. SIO3I6 TaxID=2607831 RepID=UPI0013F6D1E4|nr:SDR family NAD(P)-dependent oxidoreductase [Moorena sp. SIO3I6]NEO60350.1 SDR family NAD(P)-dependent oxidoreductase [Moorena sp. SIO4G2]NEP27753.1 SDR family NAD(P)-dependent oxidoreductase [Moorena sp. SIO3I6]
MTRLANKTAVITGGSTGIGFETAKQFIAQGARVIITGQKETRLNAAADALGENAIPVKADVRSLADLDHLAAQVEATFGKLDILFANAGIGYFAPIEQVDEAFYDNQFDINVKGVFLTKKFGSVRVASALPKPRPSRTAFSDYLCTLLVPQ